jgi:hypothetical protein
MSYLAQQQAIGNLSQGMGNAIGVQCAQPQVPGVLDMTSRAQLAMEELSQALVDLYAKVQPLVEPYPEPGCAVGQDNSCEAPAVSGLRYLVARINDKTAEIQRLTAALRV